jgi:hypothetical protein
MIHDPRYLSTEALERACRAMREQAMRDCHAYSLPEHAAFYRELEKRRVADGAESKPEKVMA